MRTRNLLLLGGLAYIGAVQIHKESVVAQAIAKAQSYNGTILNVGATGIGNVISRTATITGSHGCDIEPDAGMDYCDISQQMPYKDKEFDVVFAAHVLEHVKPLDALTALEEFQRIGKHVIIVVPNPYHPTFYVMPQHLSQVRKIGDTALDIRNNSMYNPVNEKYSIDYDPAIVEVFQ